MNKNPAWAAMLLVCISACSHTVYQKSDQQAPGLLVEMAEARSTLPVPEFPEIPFSPERDVTVSGIDLIKMFEGRVMCRSDGALHCPYDDASDYCTIGYGHLVALRACASLSADLRQAGFDDGISEAEAIRLLREDLTFAQAGVESEMTEQRMGLTGLTDPQYDALVSFVFNVGSGNFSMSTLLRKLKARLELADSQEIAYEFSRWVRSAGEVLPGLVTRRRLEAEHFFMEFDTLGNPDDPEALDFRPLEEDIVDIRQGEIQ